MAGKLFKILVLFSIIVLVLWVFSYRPIPKKITYGVSFSKHHADELDLDWKKAYLAILDDLKVRHFRLSAHWEFTEGENGKYNFSDLDFQIREAEKRGAQVIFAVGRRLPDWPECHEPLWFKGLSDEDKEKELLQYITDVVNRYKKSAAIKYWQVENEVFLRSYAKYHCGDFGGEEFLKKEIETVRKLDPDRKIVITDSGELGLWYKAYRNADAFGTSLYLYVWNDKLGRIRYPMTPGYFRVKYNALRLIYGPKESFISELSAEPWLLQPIIKTPVEAQLKQMNIERFEKVIKFAAKTGFEKQYLWGAEWWYWLKENHNRPEMWERAKLLFK